VSAELTKDTAAIAVENRNKAMAHPLRCSIFRIITERVASPAEISRQLLVDVSNVGYHMRRLQEFGMAELVDERTVRGAVEHFYRGVDLHLVQTGDWDKMPESSRTHLLVEFLQPSVDDFEASVRAGILGSDEEWAVTRTVGVFDREAFAEALALHEQLLAEMQRLRKESAGRLAESDEVGVHFSSTVNCFRIPPR
jgi:DNA-binding transcriptional ArsR family regulator